jgi:hypothetical protein
MTLISRRAIFSLSSMRSFEGGQRGELGGASERTTSVRFLLRSISLRNHATVSFLVTVSGMAIDGCQFERTGFRKDDAPLDARTACR